MELFDLEKESKMISRIKRGTDYISEEIEISMINRDEFHTYGFEINENYITWFIDDRVLYRASKSDVKNEFDDTQIFDQTYNLYLRFGARYFGTFAWTDLSHLNRDWLEVESIKVYGNESMITESSTTTTTTTDKSTIMTQSTIAENITKTSDISDNQSHKNEDKNKSSVVWVVLIFLSLIIMAIAGIAYKKRNYLGTFQYRMFYNNVRGRLLCSGERSTF